MAEVRLGNIFSLPRNFVASAWDIAWNNTCSGFDCSGLKSGFWNSIQILIPSLLMSITIASVTGYAMSLWEIPWADSLFTALLLCAFIPFQILMYPFVKLTSFINVYNSLFGVALVHAILALPILTLIFRNYYSSLPKELMQAARVDTGSFFGIFFHIILPMSTNIMVVVLIMQITSIWNDFLVGLTFGNVESFPMTVNLNNITQSQTGEKVYNVYMAASILTALPPLLVYFISGKLFVRGITEGALKG